MQKRLRRISMAVVATFVVGLLGLSSLVMATVPGTNARVSLTSTGSQSSTGGSGGILSANGKVVVFGGGNILPSGGSGTFERDLATGSVVRVNVSTAGVIDNGSVYGRMVSATGRYVLFLSNGTNLIDGTTTSTMQLYLRDVKGGTTTLVSQTSSGTLSNGTGAPRALGVSSDGRFVAFASNATNLDSGATDGSPHLYMLDRSSNSLSVIDRKTDGTIGSTSSTWWPEGSMSCDGSLIAFQYPSNLIVGDTSSNHVDVYLLDRRGGSKLSNLTKAANSAALAPRISCNGDFVGFKTPATNLDSSISVPYVSFDTYRPYIYDRVNGTYYFAAVTTSNTATSVATCTTNTDSTPCIEPSDVGTGVFRANDSTLTGSSGNQIYMRDVYAGTTELVTRDSGGTAGNGSSDTATISADGSITVYMSNSSNLVSGDTNGVYDVFTSLTGH